MLIDTHAHLNFNAFKDDADQVLGRSFDNDVWLINVGSQYETSKRAVEIAEKYPHGVYASVGLHPIHIEIGLAKIKQDPEEIQFNTREENFDYEKYKELAQSPKVVAIGEVGLDYYWKPKTKAKLELFKEKQRTVLCRQLELAKEMNLPVIFHCRMAHQDLIQFLKENEELRPPAAVSHGFVGNAEELKEYLNFGYYIGFNGIIFKNIEGIKVAETSSYLPPRATASRSVFEENIRRMPLDKILIETDCPYLTPPPTTGRNEPLYLRYVAEKIAKIKNSSYEEIAKITTENAKNLFKI